MSAGIKIETVNYVPDELLRDYFKPVRIIYNNPVTICYFADGTKRTATCRGTDQYNKEFGVSVCVIKKIFRRYSNFLKLLDSGYEQPASLLTKSTIQKLEPKKTTNMPTENEIFEAISKATNSRGKK